MFRSSQPNQSLEETAKLAWDAIAHAHSVLPLGSTNKKTDLENPNFELASKQLHALRCNERQLLRPLLLAKRKETKGSSYELTKLTCQAEIYADYQAGNCSEQAVVALVFLKRQGVDNVDYCYMKGGDHNFLLLNGAIICDPWANNVYHVRQFQLEREGAKNFQYADFVYEARPDVTPFLFGLPKILVATGTIAKPAIVKGQFVRAGEDVATLDYSEYKLAKQQLALKRKIAWEQKYKPTLFTVVAANQKQEQAAVVSGDATMMGSASPN